MDINRTEYLSSLTLEKLQELSDKEFEELDITYQEYIRITEEYYERKGISLQEIRKNRLPKEN